jgi:hypothetical protein
MLGTLLLFTTLAAATGPGQHAPAQGPDVYDGREGKLRVDLPRLDAPDITIDGHLDEGAWSEAALLTGFTQREPVEGAPASERTEVRVFYTERALYLGIRASVRDPRTLRATLAERDQITGDDHIRILLDPYNDRRRAHALYVNPLGVQQDGVMDERGRPPTDYSPDFHFASAGRVTAEGYEVEVRIPFSSLRVPSAEVQSWGLHLIRHIAATGAVESWAPLSRDEPNLLPQAGTLAGLTGMDLRRPIEVNPVVVARRDGARPRPDAPFQRESPRGEVGINLQAGLTPEITLDVTVNPDFSQVEADAGQITVNERFAVAYPEMRSFFLEGADIFSGPERLVHTRRIVSPLGAAKVTGRREGIEFGYLGALDDLPAAGDLPGERAFFHIARASRSFGSGRSAGGLVTHREGESEANTVAATDTRIRFGRHHTAIVQAAGSRTASDDGTARVGHLLHASLDKTARNHGYYLRLVDLPRDFVSRAGFIPRTGYSDLFGMHRLSWFGAEGALIQRTDLRASGGTLWTGREMWSASRPVEGWLRVSPQVRLRGNTEVGVEYTQRFYDLDPAVYAHLSGQDPDGNRFDGAAVVEPIARHRGLHGLSLSLASDYFRRATGSLTMEIAETPVFAEGVRGRASNLTLSAAMRPTAVLRVDARLAYSELHRQHDGSRYSRAVIPRLRAEYQITRDLFVRGTGQYLAEEVDYLRAPGGAPYLREGVPFRLRRGETVLAGAAQSHPLQLEALISYRPAPGTTLFLGYGREMMDAEAFRFGQMPARSEGLFLKASYLFRI